jgi:hypothetical protein
MSEPFEQRKHKRVYHDETVDVTVTSCDEAPPLVGQTVRCMTRDASTAGLRVRLDLELPVGCELGLRVEASGVPKPFELEGEVAWLSPSSTDDDYVVGILLHEKPKKAMRAWRDFILRKIRFTDPYA